MNKGPIEWVDGDVPLPASGMEITHRLSPLNRRLRLEFIAGAGDESRDGLGRSAHELARVLRRYPGDIGTRTGR